MPLSMDNLPSAQQRAASSQYPNKSMLAGKLTLVFTVRRKKDKQVLKEHRLICMPTSYEETTEGRSQLYYTKEGIYVDMPQREAIGATYFTIGGHTLYRGINYPKASGGLATLETALNTITSAFSNINTTQGSGSSSVDGAAAMKDLQDTIRLYFFPDAQGQASSSETARPSPGDLQLEYLNLNAPIAADDTTGLMGWIIHPHRGLVTLRQDAQHPFLWYYQFQFAGIALLKEAKMPDGFSADFSNKKSLVDTVLDRFDEFVSGVETLYAATQELTQEVTGPISRVVNNVAQLSDAVEAFESGVAAKIAYPLSVSQSLERSVDALS